MSFMDKVGAFFKREAKDLGDAAEGVKSKLDEELTKREQELAMTPSEKIAALQEQAAANDARFDEIADKALGQEAMAEAVAEVGSFPPATELPSVTHIVMPDGSVQSGHDVTAAPVVDADGTLHEVPGVSAPSAEELQKDVATPAPPVDSEVAAPTEPLPQADDAAAVGAGPTETAPAPEADDPAAAAAAVLAGYVSERSEAEPTAKAAAETPAPNAAADVTDLPPPPAPEAPAAAAVASEVPAAAADVTDLPPPPAPEAPAAAVAASEVPAAAADVTDLPPPPAPEAPAAPDAPAPEDVAAAPEPAAPEPAAAEAISPLDSSSPDYGKTPAQLKYERARAAANELLDELRGELKEDGEI